MTTGVETEVDPIDAIYMISIDGGGGQGGVKGGRGGSEWERVCAKGEKKASC